MVGTNRFLPWQLSQNLAKYNENYLTYVKTHHQFTTLYGKSKVIIDSNLFTYRNLSNYKSYVTKLILNGKLHCRYAYLVSSIHSFNYGSFFTRPCLNVRAISFNVKDSKKSIISERHLSINFQTCLVVAHEEAKTQVASLQKELFEIAELKTLTTN